MTPQGRKTSAGLLIIAAGRNLLPLSGNKSSFSTSTHRPQDRPSSELPFRCAEFFSNYRVSSLSRVLHSIKKKSGQESQTHHHPQKCRTQNPRSTRVAQLAAHSLPTFGGGGPNARTTRPPPRRSPFLCIDLTPQCLCPETGVELLTAGSSRHCDVSLPSAVQSSLNAHVLPVTSTANTLDIAGDVHIRTPKQPGHVLGPGTRPVRRVGTAEDRQPRDRQEGLPIPALEPNNPNNHCGCFTIHGKCPVGCVCP